MNTNQVLKTLEAITAELVAEGEPVYSVHDTGETRTSANGNHEFQVKIDLGGTDHFAWTDGTVVDGLVNFVAP